MCACMHSLTCFVFSRSCMHLWFRKAEWTPSRQTWEQEIDAALMCVQKERRQAKGTRMPWCAEFLLIEKWHESWRAANDFFGHIKNRERPSPLPVSDTVFSPSICHRWPHTWFWLWLEHPASIPQPHFQLPTKSLARQQLSLLILVTGGFLSKNCSQLILAHSWLAGRDGSQRSSFHYWEGALDLRVDQASKIHCIVFSNMSGGICGRCACRHPGGRGSNILRLWITCYVASCRTMLQCQRWTWPWPERVRSDGKNIRIRGAFMGVIALLNHMSSMGNSCTPVRYEDHPTR